ncbi:MAG: hypothetical protein V2J24_20165 [Pseudomonadales bacterium]|jgi:hypothetical protein|nr:hypothetical protein [Pseudomonadales bacterium]
MAIPQRALVDARELVAEALEQMRRLRQICRAARDNLGADNQQLSKVGPSIVLTRNALATAEALLGGTPAEAAAAFGAIVEERLPAGLTWATDVRPFVIMLRNTGLDDLETALTTHVGEWARGSAYNVNSGRITYAPTLSTQAQTDLTAALDAVLAQFDPAP